MSPNFGMLYESYWKNKTRTGPRMLLMFGISTITLMFSYHDAISSDSCRRLLATEDPDPPLRPFTSRDTFTSVLTQGTDRTLHPSSLTNTVSVDAYRIDIESVPDRIVDGSYISSANVWETCSSTTLTTTTTTSTSASIDVQPCTWHWKRTKYRDGTFYNRRGYKPHIRVTAFPGPPRVTDMIQTEDTGACFFYAAAGAIAQQFPELLTKYLITPSTRKYGNHFWRVQLHTVKIIKNPRGPDELKVVPVWIKVDDTFESHIIHGQIITKRMAEKQDQFAFWPLLLYKSYCLFKNDIACKMKDGGHIAVALFHLTGCSRHIQLENDQLESLNFKALQDCLQSEWLVVAGWALHAVTVVKAYTGRDSSGLKMNYVRIYEPNSLPSYTSTKRRVPGYYFKHINHFVKEPGQIDLSFDDFKDHLCRYKDGEIVMMEKEEIERAIKTLPDQQPPRLY